MIVAYTGERRSTCLQWEGSILPLAIAQGNLTSFVLGYSGKQNEQTFVRSQLAAELEAKPRVVSVPEASLLNPGR